MPMAFDIRDGNRIYKYIIDLKPREEQDSFVEHFHTDYELLYFVHGDADFIIEQNRYSLKPHSLLIIKPGEHHNLVVLSNEQYYERIVLRFNSVDIPEQLDEKLIQLASVYNIAGTKLSEALFRLDMHCRDVSTEYITELLKGLLIEILVYLCSGENSVQKAEYVNEYFAQIMSFIDGNLTGIQKLDDICNGLHLSRSTISRLVYAQINVPVMSYVRTKKCMLAQAMLSRGLPPTVVSEKCGFGDYSSFYRAYKKVFQGTPSENKL